MPQSLLDKMNYDQLFSLAKTRKIPITEPTNSEDLRKAIHDWEVNRGLPFKGLRDLTPQKSETDIEAHLLDLKNTLGELTTRIANIEAILKERNNA